MLARRYWKALRWTAWAFAPKAAAAAAVAAQYAQQNTGCACRRESTRLAPGGVLVLARRYWKALRWTAWAFAPKAAAAAAVAAQYAKQNTGCACRREPT